MNSRIVIVGLFSLLAGLSGATAAGTRTRVLDGHWEGAIRQPAGEVNITVDLSTGPEAVTGAFTLPAAAVFRWPLKGSHDSSSIKFRLPTGTLFEGHVQGETISGKVPSPTGGHVDPFYLKRRPAPVVPYTEEEVTFESGGIALTGTLRLPTATGTHAAVFLLQGSGDADRTAEAFYADHFARHGIVALTYDKRGTGRSGGDHRTMSFDDFAADALAGVRYLQTRREVNPKHVGLSGRSHGGMVAPLAAARSTNVAFVINVSGAGVSPHRQMTYQTAAEMRRDGFSDAEIAEAVAYMNHKWHVARAGGAGWSELQLATQNARSKRWLPRVQPATALKDIVPSWKLQMGYDPMPALEKMTCPFLAVFGELDTSTPVDETIANYQKGAAKSGNKSHEIKVFPGADHALLVWPKPGDEAHWPVLAPGYLDAMTEWLKTQFAARRGVKVAPAVGAR